MAESRLARGVLHDRVVAAGPPWTPAPLLGAATLDDLILLRARELGQA